MTDDEKNKKKEDIFDLFGIDFEEIEHIFETMIERLKEKIGNREDIKDLLDKMETRNSFMRGFSMTFGPNGNPHFDMFGDHISHGEEISEEREPLTDIIEEAKGISVTIEIPGVEKDDIDIKVMENTLEITVNTLHRKYHKKIQLPTRVKPETTKATYKNGVLDVEIAKSGQKTGFSVKVE
jgi:HSP20 family protein